MSYNFREDKEKRYTWAMDNLSEILPRSDKDCKRLATEVAGCRMPLATALNEARLVRAKATNIVPDGKDNVIYAYVVGLLKGKRHSVITLKKGEYSYTDYKHFTEIAKGGSWLVPNITIKNNRIIFDENIRLMDEDSFDFKAMLNKVQNHMYRRGEAI
ncbi:hypothetical protein D3C81_07040 [compost metagenome]